MSAGRQERHSVTQAVPIEAEGLSRPELLPLKSFGAGIESGPVQSVPSTFPRSFAWCLFTITAKKWGVREVKPHPRQSVDLCGSSEICFLPHKPTQLSIFWAKTDLQIHLFDVCLYPDSGPTKAEEDHDQIRGAIKYHTAFGLLWVGLIHCMVWQISRFLDWAAFVMNLFRPSVIEIRLSHVSIFSLLLRIPRKQVFREYWSFLCEFPGSMESTGESQGLLPPRTSSRVNCGPLQSKTSCSMGCFTVDPQGIHPMMVSIVT
ncbi:hypothetical protein T11_8931 [Trichinella zimbabwensis]|uniref:Uncharacterized protein n=1 Tax=Trichinella zimbabwensis TaxID=268475 RepID=A0A0V1HRG2_9BILA|nr:hypothetical protein T11_8931 [Trichinella zimbabwensis]